MSAPRADFAVEAAPGIVAASPAETFQALADIAESDGADREAWIEKAVRSATHVHVGGEPRYQIVRDAAADGAHVFNTLVESMRREIVALLESGHA